MLNRRLTILAVSVVAAVGLQLSFTSQSLACDSPPRGDSELFQTQEACDSTLGDVRLIIDAFGATGSASGGGRACFDPADDEPDDGMVSTIFESMAFLCTERASGSTEGNWLDTGETRNVAYDAVRVEDEVTSNFSLQGLAVEARFPHPFASFPSQGTQKTRFCLQREHT